MITKFVLLVVCINLLCWIQVDAHAWLCPANEEWGHGPNCDAKCGPQTLQACHPEGMGCKCSSGYSRNEHGQCVPDFLCSIESFSPNSLWSKYSMLKSTLLINYCKIDTGKYSRLGLKQLSRGYVPKKSKILSREDVLKFLAEASNDTYLPEKVVLVYLEG